MSDITLTPVTLRDGDEVRNLLRSERTAVGPDLWGQLISVHLEKSGDPLPHGPDEMEPAVCINLDGTSSGDPNDDTWISITDPEALEQLITALTAAGPILRQLRKEAGL